MSRIELITDLPDKREVIVIGDIGQECHFSFSDDMIQFSLKKQCHCLSFLGWEMIPGEIQKQEIHKGGECTHHFGIYESNVYGRIFFRMCTYCFQKIRISFEDYESERKKSR